MQKVKRILSLLLTIVMVVTTVTSTGVIALAASESDIAPMSLLPLEEVQAYLVLNEYSSEDLRTMSVDSMLDMLVNSNGQKVNIDKNATTVWRYCKDETDGLEEYQKYSIGQNDTIDLSAASNVKAYNLELLIGSENQLDSQNKRYIVKVYVTKTVMEELEYELYSQDANGKRTSVVPDRKLFATNTQLGFSIDANEYIVSAPAEGSQYYLGINSLASEHPNLSVEVYDFFSYLFSGGNTDSLTPLTNTILNQNMEQKDAGLSLSYDGTAMFAILYYYNGQYDSASFVSFSAVSDSSYIDGSLYAKDDNQFADAVLLNVTSIGFEDIDSVFAGEGVRELCLMLKDGYSLDSDLYCVLNAHGKTFGDEANSHVTKAVKGHYKTLEEAQSCEDIKDQLIPVDQSAATRGYKDNFDYRDGGVPFTVFFDDGNVWQLLVLAMEYDSKYDENYIRSFTDKPIIGEADPWFRVTGAENSQGKSYDTYVIENGKSMNLDTYYGYGYQTLFINDASADLSQLKPIFWYANTDRVYAVSKDTGSRVEDDHIRDFSNENQQYTGVIIENGKENNRNYWVTFKKLNNSGPELYVFGPSEREVILDEYFEYKHDILIANIGNATLEDLSVELYDAENVKLDSYWTVGGANNDTLAPFTTTSSSTKYGEIPNVAKIRLLPDGDGEVKGTLIIKAKGQDPVLITLNGTAQQPDIVTETVSDAVKYVPYSHIVATNNIHDWNDVTFELSDGVLPAGVELNTKTGELYGTPQEAGEFKFTVKALYTYFEPSYVELTLTVKDNTNDNVFEASDEGYAILDAIGEDNNGDHDFVLREISDQEFRSNGAFADFVDLWLNGEKLVEGEDYDVSEGSTRITIRSQTFEDKANQEGSNTIAAEFRTGGGDPDGTHEGDLKRTAQNFTIETTEKSDPEVDNVIALINAIPSIVTLNDKATVEKARAVYDKLSSTQKQAVTNYSKLQAAEAAIATLEENERKDREAANKVIALIDAIPTPVTLNSKDAINAARSAYNMLTSTQKGYVTNYSKLTSAEAALEKLEAAERERAKVNEVIALINAIPDSVTLNDKATVEAARKAYDALTADQKKDVINYSKLVDAENTIAALEALEKASAEDRAAAQTVIDIIDNLPDPITLNDKDAVEAARSAYENLTDTQKQLVTNLGKLTKAEETIAALEAYEAASEADKAAADKVIDMIDNLPDPITLKDKDAVEAARKAYDELTDAQKKIVYNYDDLIAAEVAIAELENEEYQSHQSVTFVGRVVDKNGNPMADVIVEIHSTVQTARTDSNGYFRFNDVEMGEHSITVKDTNGKVIATKNFTIVAGSPLSLVGDTITAENGAVFTMTIQAEQDMLTFLSLQEGDHTTPGTGNNPTPGIDIGSTSPQTGDNTNLLLWYILLVLSLSGLIVTTLYNRKKSRA